MANMAWGKVYYQDIYVGRLQEEPGGRVLFTYDPSYLEARHPAIAHSLPLQSKSFVSESGLHPFFDNLVAEGWLKSAQARALGVRPQDRLALLLGFGVDLAGAVSVVDPEREGETPSPHGDVLSEAVVHSRASLSGIQRKITVIKADGVYRAAGPYELSTHIAKFSSGELPDLIALEYLTTEATRCLLPDDAIVDLDLSRIEGVPEDALVIPRFDRIQAASGVMRLHFEEFNALLSHDSDDKYEGSYEEMGQFILNTRGCMPAEAARLFRRILACLLTGNTDAHFKNFAMFHTRDGLRLTPAYDLVAAATYPAFQTVALSLSGIKDLQVGQLKAKHLLQMAKGFGVRDAVVMDITGDLGKKLPKALEAVSKSGVGHKRLRDQIISTMERRWNGSFKSIGPLLSKKHGKGV